ncbi:MAG: hypothetical protein H7645_10245 [Candidatus Heimdallarchaeota archaeon]|nr:hypothetical protein [Candidatus Heimdallarchaeota archaeon]MCK4770708.1 hypothetical protein [Candidatus Heimdallarchaeota archaeon]
MTYVRRQAAKYVYRKIAYALKKYLTNFAPVKIQDKNTIFFLTKPKRIEGKKQIVLVIIGDFDESIISEIESDLTAGIAEGWMITLEKMQEVKFKADNLQVLENAYQDYEFKHKEVGVFGTAISREIYEDRYVRKALKSTTKIKGMNWYEDFNNMFPRLKAKKFTGKPVIKFYEKLVTKNEWIIPIEAVRIWQHVKHYTGKEVTELANELEKAILTNDETKEKQITKDIESFIKREDSKE